APRDVLHQLAVPLLRAQALRRRRRVAQPRVAGAGLVRRVLASQPPCLPDERGPRPALVRARHLVAGHPRDEAPGLGLRGHRDLARAPGQEARRGPHGLATYGSAGSGSRSTTRAGRGRGRARQVADAIPRITAATTSTW